MLANFKRPRVTDDRHLEYVRQLPCVCCMNPLESEAAHIRTGEPLYGKRNTGMSEKPSDLWVLPLCNKHHSEQHRGNEMEFWRRYGMNPFVLALSLYACTGDQITGEQVIRAQKGIRR